MKYYILETMLNEDNETYIKKTGHITKEDIQGNSPGAILKIVNNIFNLGYKAEENLILLGFDGAFRLKNIQLMGIGTINECIVPIREIFRTLLLMDCASFSIVHNHPSGILTPSTADVKAAERIKKASDLIGIKFADFIIIQKETYFSFFEKNLM